MVQRLHTTSTSGPTLHEAASKFVQSLQKRKQTPVIEDEKGKVGQLVSSFKLSASTSHETVRQWRHQLDFRT